MLFLVLILSKFGRNLYFMFRLKREFKNANIPRTIRFTEPLFQELNDVAHQNSISLNLLVLQCCRYALNNMESETQ